MERLPADNSRMETAKRWGAFLFFTLGAAGLGGAGIELAQKDAPNTEVAMTIIDIFAIGFTAGSVMEWRDLWRKQR